MNILINQTDFRLLSNGKVIPTECYSDQPYLVKADDGAWVCTVTTGPGREGEHGEHVMVMRSEDQGQNWTGLQALEPPDAPESAYSVLLKADSGRIFCFYNYNLENRRSMRTHPCNGYPEGSWERVDSQGHFFFRYSDDNGKSWSSKRYEIPIRKMEIDRTNLYGGEVQMFWNVGKAFSYRGEAYVPLHKIGALGEGGFRVSEGVLLHSPDLLIQIDPGSAAWETLPDGDIGLRTPVGGGMVAEEQSFCVLSDGTFYCVYRSVDGYPVEVYSSDGGHTFTPPAYKQYEDGRPVKHPRAANFAWRCENGRYLYWFHNHGGRDYAGRNPVWVCGGEEVQTPTGKRIVWSQPEILLYDPDVNTIISYPDMLEDCGKLYITETQKVIGRCHEIPKPFLEKLWKQRSACTLVQEELLLFKELEMDAAIQFPVLPLLDVENPILPESAIPGFTIEVCCSFHSFDAYQTVFSTLRGNRGIRLRMAEGGVLEIQLGDGFRCNRWRTVPGLLEMGKRQYISIIADAGAKILSFVVNGKFCDGGRYMQYGWGRLDEKLSDVNTDCVARMGCSGIEVKHLRIYGRALMTSECVANYRFDRERLRKDDGA